MDTPPPPPLPPHHPVSPPPPYPSSPPPPVPPPVAYPVSSASPYAPPASQVSPTDRMVASLKNVDWRQLGRDTKTFVKRFGAGDFALVHPEPHELPAVAGKPARMASLIVWRRALLFLASVLSALLVIKTCFDPHTFRAVMMKSEMEKAARQVPALTAEAQHRQADEKVREAVAGFGEANVVVMDALLVGMWVCIIASTVFQIMAAANWRDFRRSRRLTLIGVSVLVVPQVVTMVFPWSALMNFSHIERQFVQQGMAPEQVKMALAVAVGAFQLVMAGSLMLMVLPIVYSLFTGILRATLTSKTLVPASIVCGWSTLLLALVISVPWFMVLCLVSQTQLDAIIVLGVLCLLAAPLSLLFKSRRLGAPLRPEEATPVVKRARLLFSGLNVVGVLMIVSYLIDKHLVEAEELVTGVLQYFAHLMLFTVGAVDMLALLLNRAHGKLANDEHPQEPLRQLGEVLQPEPAPPIPSLV